MSSIDTRAPFFPKSRTAQTDQARNKGQVEGVERNSLERASEIQNKTSGDARVNIPDGIKDFSRIKKAAMSAPAETDNTDKIARLKAQIEAGTYEIDYDGLADKILSTEY